jgi:hypothetical protein
VQQPVHELSNVILVAARILDDAPRIGNIRVLNLLPLKVRMR